MSYQTPLLLPLDDAPAVPGLALYPLAVPLPDVRIEMVHRDLGWWSPVGEAGGGNIYRVDGMYAASSTDVRVFASPWVTIGGLAATPLDAVRLAQVRQMRVAAALRPVIAAVNDRRVSIYATDGNSYFLRRDEEEYNQYFSWDTSMEMAHRMFGGATVADFVRRYTGNLNAMKRAAVQFCRMFPELRLCIYYSTKHYEFFWQGEYVHIRLPYHDHGGEVSWLSRDGRTAVKVDVD